MAPTNTNQKEVTEAAAPSAAPSVLNPSQDGGHATSFEGRIVVAACDKGGGIGMNGQMPWPKLRDDMQHFRHLTAGSAVVMGRVTFESLPAKSKPLPGRLNVVLTRDVTVTRAKLLGDASENDNEQLVLANSLDAAQQLLTSRGVLVAYVIGGEAVYEEALNRPMWSKKVFLTHVHTSFACDRFFPVDRVTGSVSIGNVVDTKETVNGTANGNGSITGSCFRNGHDNGEEGEREKKKAKLVESQNHDDVFECVAVRSNLRDNDVEYSIKEYVRVDGTARPSTNPLGNMNGVQQTYQRNCPLNSEEGQYLDLVKHIMEHGIKRTDRTGTGTLSVFGAQMRFNLHDDVFPLLTTKRVFWRGVVEELFWFIRGATDGNQLSAKGVHIWDANGSRAFLDGRGFKERAVGDLGPVYGFQWRHFGAKYVDMNTNYDGQGVDQLAGIIHTLKTNPSDRRMVMSAWNPGATHLMALPPCHLLAQFYVANGRLSCQMYQRSCDMGLGVPFNIASYALLTRLLADVTGLLPGEFVHVLGDAHVYCNHVDALHKQLERAPRPFPKLRVKHRENIEDFVLEDLTLEGYNPYGPIPMKMAV